MQHEAIRIAPRPATSPAIPSATEPGTSPETSPAPRSARRPVRRPWLALLSAVMDLAQGKGELVRHAERPWASATFAGTRHSVLLTFTGAEAITAGEMFLALLSEHEFAIPGQLVADAAVVRVDHAALPEERLECEVELLLLEEG